MINASTFIGQVHIKVKDVIVEMYETMKLAKIYSSYGIVSFALVRQKNINMNGKVFHEYTWESGPGIDPIITRNISIDIADNQIHCIIARGR